MSGAGLILPVALAVALYHLSWVDSSVFPLDQLSEYPDYPSGNIDFGETDVNDREEREGKRSVLKEDDVPYLASSADPDEDVIIEALPPRAREILRYGLPGYGRLRVMQDFVVSYDRRNRVPYWVMEHITRASLGGGGDKFVNRSEQNFYEDPYIHTYFRAKNSDYKRSGYDRGHLAPAANHKKSASLQKETFTLSNIAPQVGKDFNRGIWNQLENHIRNNFVRKYNETFVATGPLYLPQRDPQDGRMYVKYEVIGNNKVAVPTHFFKVVVGHGFGHDFNMEAYVLPNMAIPEKTPLRSFLVPKEEIERAAGILLFDKISDGWYTCINRVCKNGNRRRG